MLMPTFATLNSSKLLGLAVGLLAAGFLLLAVITPPPAAVGLTNQSIDRDWILSQADYFAGERASHDSWLIINFWASWCPPCREEMPQLNQLIQARQWPEPLSLLTLSQDQSPQALQAYWKKYGFTMDGRIDPDQIISSSLGIDTFPTTLLISPENQVVWVGYTAENWTDPDIMDRIAQDMQP